MIQNTSSERIDHLIELSDQIYPIIDTVAEGQPRARRMLRLGMSVVAESLTHGSIRYTGDRLHSTLVGELACGGLSHDDTVYRYFPAYLESLSDLPKVRAAPTILPDIDRLAIQYADVTRATVSQNGSLETDASHAIHLASLALPYAAQYHPTLDQAKIALYCLLHDLVEAYVGDVASLGVSDEIMTKKHEAEQRALRQFEQEFHHEHPELVQLVLDYENLVDDEACYVKTFDKLDPGFTHFYSKGSQLVSALNITTPEQFQAAVDQTTRRMQPYSHYFPDLMRDRDTLTDRISDHTSWPM